MEQLSKKGGKYLQIYNEDIEWITNNDTVEPGSSFYKLFGGATQALTTETERVCDTVGYMDRIQNITTNTVCASYFNKSTETCNNTCANKLEELELIEDTLQKDKLYGSKNNDWQKAINKFIELIICCGREITSEPHLLFNSMSYTMISDMIVSTEKYLDLAYNILGKILKKESTIDLKLIRKFNNLRYLKQKNPAKYSEDKIKLINDELTDRNDRDRNTIFVSKIVEKIINAKQRK
jgi:hypothetical protein